MRDEFLAIDDAELPRLLLQPASAMNRLPELPSPPTAQAAAAAAPANLASVLDREVFEELVREIGEQGAAEIHALFARETATRLKLFRTLSIDSDRTRIEREAHSLKGAAGTFGYLELASLALRLERDAARIANGDYREMLDRMDTAYSAATMQELQR